jgi:hypothetical protein
MLNVMRMAASRHPRALSATETEVEQSLPPAMRANYQWIMHAYGMALMALLREGRDDPMGSVDVLTSKAAIWAQPNNSLSTGVASVANTAWRSA